MELKLVAIGCLHGRIKKETLDLIRSEKPDAVLVSGDFSGGDFSEEIRNYEKQTVDKFGPMYELWPLKVQIESDKKFMRWNRLSNQNVKKIFDALRKIEVPVYYIHGNWDTVSEKRSSVMGNEGVNLDEESGGNVKFLHEKVVKLKGYTIAGFGGYRGSGSKEYLVGRESRFMARHCIEIGKTLKRRMEAVFSKVEDRGKMIIITHDPPYRTFDYLAPVKQFYGEKVTRDLIKKHKPLLCICSHFHEHRGVKRVGKSLVLASGYGYDGQVAVIDIKDQKVKARFVG